MAVKLPRRSKVDQALLAHDIGGVLVGNSMRRTNFLHRGRFFMLSLARDVGVLGKVEVEPGEGGSSGAVRLKTDHVVIELKEPESRDGVRVAVTVDERPTLLEPIMELAEDAAFQDFVYRVKKMIRDAEVEAKAADQEK